MFNRSRFNTTRFNGPLPITTAYTGPTEFASTGQMAGVDPGWYQGVPR
jgi:hypothetical protein